MGGSFRGKSVLVTGGGSGIGEAVVTRFLDEGAHVVVLDLDDEALSELDRRHDESVSTVVGDVTAYEDNRRAVERAVDAAGSLDVLVGNAGVFDLKVSLATIDPEEIGPAYRELFDVNVLGYLNAARASLEPLRQSGGNMVFTTSCSGHMASTGGILYVPSKHAVNGLIRRLALELAPDVRVNGVAPGYVPTNLSGLGSLDQGQSPPSPHLEDVNPIGRIPDSSDYASYYTFLADDEQSGPSTGAIVDADGGLSLVGPG